jgi:metal iron transporter
MPHSLFLGSGIVQPRLREFDDLNNTSLALETSSIASSSEPESKYKPSLAAINSCMTYSIVELAISLFTFALFVNSAILIVAGASYTPSLKPRMQICSLSTTSCRLQ